MDVPLHPGHPGNFGTIGLAAFLAFIALLSTLRELARIRLDIARQRSSDLLNRRFSAYGKLWSQMNQLAVYSADTFNAGVAGSTSKNLSEWYFSEIGGLLLSTTARDFYFALQDTLKDFAAEELLQNAQHKDGRDTFKEMLKSNEAGASKYPGCVDAQLADNSDIMPGDDWRKLCKILTPHVLQEVKKDATHGSDLAFCMAQQVSSALRSRLAYEVQSRLDPAPKWWRLCSEAICRGAAVETGNAIPGHLAAILYSSSLTPRRSRTVQNAR